MGATMGKTVTILIIDDEPVVLRSCIKILSRMSGLAIDTASSGREGLEKAQQKKYDLVITDLKMPNMSGLDVLKTLRTQQPDVTVIIFTGYATVDSVREALKLGAFDYIPKPFTPEELRTVIDNAIASRKDAGDAKMLDLMAVVSHELKSPLTAVHTTAETLYKGYFGNLPAEQQKTIETILRNCQYLEDIIRNYLDLSKMELDELASFNQELDLVRDVLEPVLAIPEHRDNVKHMAIAAEFSVSPRISGDPNLLKIVFTNLVNNAIKYGTPETTISVALQETDSTYVVSVYNRGVGISAEDISQRLFGKFVRLKQKGTSGVKGSGLGLYICRTIVEKHGGTIRAQSEEGAWTKFFVSFPKHGS